MWQYIRTSISKWEDFFFLTFVTDYKSFSYRKKPVSG